MIVEDQCRCSLPKQEELSSLPVVLVALWLECTGGEGVFMFEPVVGSCCGCFAIVDQIELLYHTDVDM
jgi:hypothetical protein